MNLSGFIKKSQYHQTVSIEPPLGGANKVQVELKVEKFIELNFC